MQEFFAQGDDEKRRDLSVSPLCDRNDTDSIPNSQKGFINFLVKPLFSVFVEYLELELSDTIPSLGRATAVFKANLDKNHEMWEGFEGGDDSELFDPSTLTPFEKTYEKALQDEYVNAGDINLSIRTEGPPSPGSGTRTTASKSMGTQLKTWRDDEEDEEDNSEQGDGLSMRRDLLADTKPSDSSSPSKRASLGTLGTLGKGGKTKRFITSGEGLEELSF
eukprot:CAMPEP_0182471408 /NCGR_PEP_ID=MMETSP1319-20130603/20277_1 /TAXON_ID=172717 /ORGANISM="Bolidomonas pacifica, Strain RCC208" /LENGTH=219 /DNA_ID=CAMNT_0024671957 /DNA_START=12 /DNA_END=668 /DNA_ORIENTATION=-